MSARVHIVETKDAVVAWSKGIWRLFQASSTVLRGPSTTSYPSRRQKLFIFPFGRVAPPYDGARNGGVPSSDVLSIAHGNRVLTKPKHWPASHGQGDPCIISTPPMHLLYILRPQQLLGSCYLILDHILDYRMYPLHTTASAPSMRASDASYAFSSPAPMNDDPGNVKVVVRCRAFVRRGSVTVLN
jgi:hypothetical protein